MSVAKVGLPLLAAVLIVGAGVATLWMIGSASGERAKFSSLDIAPKEADAFFAINTDPTSPQWLAVNDSLGDIGAKDPIRDAIDDALAEVNLEWEEDILPVAGDEAFFSVPEFDEVEGSSGFVAGFQIADEDKAQEVFDSLRERAEDEGEELAEEEYEGVTIYYTERLDTPDGDWFGYGSPIEECPEGMQCDVATLESADSGAVALFDEVLAIGGSTDDVKSVIDVVQGRAPSAKENERLTEFREAQRGDFLMWGYADLASVWEMLEEGIATEVGSDSGEDVPLEIVGAPELETEPPDTDYEITSFRADYTLDDFGGLFATETIEVDFGTSRVQGIVRDFDTLVPYDEQYNESLEVWVGTVLRDGEEILYEWPFIGDGTYRIITGEPETTVTGKHTYVINYTITGGVYQWQSGGPDAEYSVVFDATGTLLVPMENVSVTMTVPPTGTIKTVGCSMDESENLTFTFIDGTNDCTAEAVGNVATFTPTAGEVPEGSAFKFNVAVFGESGRSKGDVYTVPIPGFNAGSGVPLDDGFTVTSFDADYTINADGTLSVVETIDVDFGENERRGITRDFWLVIPYDFFDNERIQVIPGEVTQDGAPAVVNTPEIGIDQLRIQIGDADQTITGAHSYVINYTMVGGIHQWSTGDEFAYYEVILEATGTWGVPLEQVSVSFTDPNGGLSGSSCTIDTPEVASELYFPGEYDRCFVELLGDTAATFTSDGPVEAGSVMAFLVGVEGESGRNEEDVVLEPNGDFFDGFDDDGFGLEDDQPLIPFDIDTEELLEQLKGTYDRVGFSVSSTSDGFAFDVTVLHAEGFEPEFAFHPTQAFDSHFAESVSAETMFFFAGYDIYGQNYLPAKQWFEDVEFTDGKTIDDFLDDFEDETGLHLEDDILSLLTGEYAVAGDVSDWDQDTPDFNILALLDVADSNRAQDTLDELGNYLEDQGMVFVDESNPIQEWSFAESDDEAIGVTEEDGAVIAGYPVSAVEDAVGGHAISLSDTEEWKRTVGLLPDDTTSIGFLSIARILDEASKVDDFEDGLDEATDGEVTIDQLRALRSVGYATTSRENGFGVHFVLFVEER